MISEVDIQDWDHLPPVPLYTVRPRTYIHIDGMSLWFDHLDGAYSYCMTFSGDVVHISANAMVEQLVRKEKSNDV